MVPSHMFNFEFQKSADEIIEKVKTKVVALRAKIEERQGRVTALRKEYGIDDAALIQLLTEARKAMKNGTAKMSYSLSNVRTFGSDEGGGQITKETVIGAGVVNNLLTENDFIETERDQVRRLELIVRNLKPIKRFANASGTEIPPDGFSLSYGELEYLGF